jgi:hypothetical protein
MQDSLLSDAILPEICLTTESTYGLIRIEMNKTYAWLKFVCHQNRSTSEVTKGIITFHSSPYINFPLI